LVDLGGTEVTVWGGQESDVLNEGGGGPLAGGQAHQVGHRCRRTGGRGRHREEASGRSAL